MAQPDITQAQFQPNDWWTSNAPPTATATPGFTPTPGSGGTPYPTGGAPAGPNSHWDASTGTFVPNTDASSVPPTLNTSDPASVAAYVSYYATQPGANPSLARDPNYWIQKISSGELGQDPNYIIGKFMTPEGAPTGGGGGMQSPGALPVTDYGGIGSTPSPYVSPTWTGGPAPTGPTLTNFTAPTQAELEASPGYQSRLAAGLEAGNRSAAAHGTVLNGGTQQALAQYGQNYASNEYSNLFGQKLAGVQTNNQTAETGFGNAFQTYQQNYGNFVDQSARSAATYQTNVNNTRNAGNDYWQHLNDLYTTGANAANNSYKGTPLPP